MNVMKGTKSNDLSLSEQISQFPEGLKLYSLINDQLSRKFPVFRETRWYNSCFFALLESLHTSKIL